MDSPSISPLDHNQGCSSAENGGSCMASASSGSHTLSDKSLVGVLLAIAFVLLGFVLWMFFARRWQDRRTAVLNRVLGCRRRPKSVEEGERRSTSIDQEKGLETATASLTPHSRVAPPTH